jgi:hypothetical protein
MLLILALFGIALLAQTALAGPKDKRLDIYWIDVEGGAATLIVTPAGETVLIDAGNPVRRDTDRIVKAVTETAGMKQVDHLIITHYHGDHFGGVTALSTLLPIVNMYDNGRFADMPNDPGKAYFEIKCKNRAVINPGDKLPLVQGQGKDSLPISLTCLGTRQTFIAPAAGTAENTDICATGREKNRDGSDNANSVVTRLAFGPFRSFHGGDLTWNQEAKLVCPKDLIGPVDVYQVTHHGLDASNNPLVLKTIQPRVAIMNNGPTKGCLPEVFATLTETKSLQGIYQLHKNLRPDGSVNNVPDEFIANTEKECQGNLVKLSIAADGKSYTVSIPAKGHERTFETKGK